MAGLRISAKLALPLEVAGEAIAILAKRGAGKTNTGRVFVEELHAAKVQTVVLDPVGAWWGLRSSADGKGKGLAIPVIGGQHGDVPLQPEAGRLLADVVVDTGASLILDLSDFSKSQQRRFVADFCEQLYQRKARSPSLLHVVLEEADEFAPQSSPGQSQSQRGESARMKGAIETLVRRGRGRGLGLTMITQRSAVLDKDVLTQADVLLAMRTTGPQDVKAIELWISRHAEGGDDVVASLPSLKTGEAWVWNPERGILSRVQIRLAHTFDSSATPKAGQKRVEPRELAPIDLARLGNEIQATAERAKENDPTELRKKVRTLERKLAEQKTPAEVETIEVPVEMPVIHGEQIDMLNHAVKEVQAQARDFRGYADYLEEAVKPIAEGLQKITGTRVPVTAEGGRSRARTRPSASPGNGPLPARQPARERPPSAAPTDSDASLGKGERKVLGVLAEYPEGRTVNELAFLAGYSAKASTIGVILSSLRKVGYVESGNQPVRPTEAGLDAIGGPVERPTGQALLDQWLQHPRMRKGERDVLLALLDLYPNEPTHDELCEMTGYSPTASTMGVILSSLRKLGLVEKGRRRLAPEFVEAVDEERAAA